MDGAEKFFEKYDADKVNTHEVPYDVNSIMQYGEKVGARFPRSTISQWFYQIWTIEFHC